MLGSSPPSDLGLVRFPRCRVMGRWESPSLASELLGLPPEVWGVGSGEQGAGSSRPPLRGSPLWGWAGMETT